jgi:outer membrane receptor for Fe3+-dicitrate
LDASVGVILMKAARHSVRVQADVRNLTDRLTVINFAGLFSGTALAPPRSVAIRLRADF